MSQFKTYLIFRHVPSINRSFRELLDKTAISEVAERKRFHRASTTLHQK